MMILFSSLMSNRLELDADQVDVVGKAPDDDKVTILDDDDDDVVL